LPTVLFVLSIKAATPDPFVNLGTHMNGGDPQAAPGATASRNGHFLLRSFVPKFSQEEASRHRQTVQTSFFLSWVAKTQVDHWTKWVMGTRSIT